MNRMNSDITLARKRRYVRVLVSACAALVLTVSTMALGATTTSAAPRPHKHFASTLAVATAYFQVLNTGMATGDFSGLQTVFAPDAVLTKSNPDGKTSTYHGLTEITAFYQGLHDKIAGWQWTTDETRALSKTVLIAYEHAGSPPLSVASRCVHVFVVAKGKIVSYDWTAFYPGQK